MWTLAAWDPTLQRPQHAWSSELEPDDPPTISTASPASRRVAPPPAPAVTRARGARPSSESEAPRPRHAASLELLRGVPPPDSLSGTTRGRRRPLSVADLVGGESRDERSGGGIEMVTASVGSSRGAPARVAARGGGVGGGGGGPGSPRASAAAAALAALRRRWRWAAPSGASPLERAAHAFLVASAALVLSCALYLYVFRYVGRGGRAVAAAGFVGDAGLGAGGEPCDMFDGAWVPDRTGRLPLYNSTECPFAERGFDCLANGRNDTGYLKWRWKPRRCEVPLFSPRAALERLRGKRVVFVGDSMSRTQWESFICMLMAGVDDPRTVFEVNGNEITKTIRHLAVRFSSHGITVEFFRSVFLVQQHPAPRHAPKRVKSTLRVDRMDNLSRKWLNSDVLIFNTGHWWTPTKLFDMGCYFQAGRSLKLGTSIEAGFRMALETWASWVEKRVDLNRTHVFFRTYEPSHWGDTSQKVCEVTEQPSLEAKGNDKSEFGAILADVVANMKVPITVLNVTLMGAFRTDAHVGSWSYPPTILDCSHWCLPGVPDTWNELVFSYILTNGWRNMSG